MNALFEGLRELRRYPSAMAGLVVIVGFVAMALYAVLAIPYGTALELWRGGDHWRQHPINARPSWTNWFRAEDLPTTLRVAADDANAVVSQFEGATLRTVAIDLDYEYRTFPSELNLFVEARYESLQPFVRLTWKTPDGRAIPLGARRIERNERISISQDQALERRLGLVPQVGLLADPASEGAPRALPGRYRIELEAVLFEPDSTVSATLVSYGRVHGMAGTDHQRRDLMVALLWGTPIALAFGLIAAIGTTLATLVIAAAGVWFGGWLDSLIQRITEVNMILPVLPILVMVGTLYSTSIWIMLGVVVTFGVFSGSIKMYRAMLLPIREAAYIEAARVYGASNTRMILRYMIPRVLPVLIPSFVTLVPGFVFLEASLAVLGLGDPQLPTWGKIMNDAQTESALYNGYYYWVLSPATLLMLTGLGFAMLGFALDRVFNPRLRAI
ncbi:MAG: ABC transporter permease [Deltaproteobacteria bacterium]|nr:ABC transporter permease [Deltaproteobacteria bacterium]